MKTPRVTYFAAFAIALVLSIALNGGMLMKFDAVSHDSTMAQHQTTNTIQLSTVTVVGKRS